MPPLDCLGGDPRARRAAGAEHDDVAHASQARQPTGGRREFRRTGSVDERRVAALAEPTWHSGGGGLVSTAADYHRFTQFLLRGGELDGVRLLGPRTVRFMTRNHLPGNRDLASFSPEGFAETILDGIGFGLGFAVVLDPVPSRVPSSVGEFYWGGLASTAFWVDPVEEVTALLFTQLMPSSTYPLRGQLRQLVYSSLVD